MTERPRGGVDAVVAVLVVVVAAGGGALMGSSMGAVLGGGAGLVAAVAAGVAGMRPLVTLVVAVATVAGIVAGQSVVAALCRPGSCVPLEITGAAISGVGALVGTGLVVALVARSFDEYRDGSPSRERPDA